MNKFTHYIFTGLLVSVISGCQSMANFDLTTNTKPEQPPLTKLSDKRLAEIAQKSGDFKTSARLYRKLLQQEPENKYFVLALSNIYRDVKQPEVAIKLLLSKLSSEPEQAAASAAIDIKLWQTLGLAYLDTANYPEAKKALLTSLQFESNQQANKAQTNKAQSYNALGVAHSWLGQYQQAQDSFNQALQIKPRHVEYQSNLALNFILQQNYKQSVAVLFPLYQQGRSSAKMRQHLALALVKLSHYAQARQILAEDLLPQQIEHNINYYKALGDNQVLTLGVTVDDKLEP